MLLPLDDRHGEEAVEQEALVMLEVGDDHFEEMIRLARHYVEADHLGGDCLITAKAFHVEKGEAA